MKKLLLILLCLPMIGFGQNVNIPDANFKAYLVGNTAINTNEDAEIQLSEATAFSGSILCENMNIADLTGIEVFPIINALHCYNNQLTSLDVSANLALNYLRCDNNQLTSLDVSANLALTYLYCDSNQITSLDVSQNTALFELGCGGNQLSILDVSQNTNLGYLDCSINQLTNLDVISNTTLRWLHCGSNQLTCLDLRANIFFSPFQGPTISVPISFSSINSPNLFCISVSDPLYSDTAKITNDSIFWINIFNIDTSTSFGITCYQDTGYTYIPDDNFEQRLIDLGYDTYLDNYVFTSSIDTVTYLNVSNSYINDLTGILDFTALTYFHCDSNQLISLDLSANTDLDTLNCSMNQLTNLDLSQNTTLSYLDCSINQLASLDVSQNTTLSYLDCSINQLTSLDVSQNTTLSYLYCFINQLASLDISNNFALNTLNCSDNQITSLDVSSNLALTYLYCQSNQLTSLDVSQNTTLSYLHCGFNQLTFFDVNSNFALTYLFCYYNQLTSLDVSNNTALKHLGCNNNDFTSLDVSQNTNLEFLNCSYNELERLDLRNGNNINFTFFSAMANYNLTCISVDDPLWAYANLTNMISTAFSINCFGCIDSTACNYDSTASFNDASCVFEYITPTLACWETAIFNTTTCVWDITGTQDPIPTLACWETAIFNTTTCVWDVTGTQDPIPTLACWESATFNTTTCVWDVTGTQGPMPTLACWESAIFNATTCVWDVTGTQEPMPTLACWETAIFNTTTCVWDVTGTQEPMPTLACWELAIFNTTTCVWDVTGTQLLASISQSGDSLFAVTTPIGLNANWYNIQTENGETGIWLMEEDVSSFNPTFDCSYFIIVSDNGCTDTSEIYAYGENAARIGSFVTSPNPTSGLINVKFDNPKNQFVMFELISNNGSKLDEFITIENNLDIDLSKYSSGSYYLYFNSEDAVQGCRLEVLQKVSTKIILNK